MFYGVTVSGWKSDFEDEEENVRGVVYFLDKANRGRLQLPFLKDNVLTDFRYNLPNGFFVAN